MKVPQQKHPSVFLQARHQGKCHVGLPLCHNTLSRKGTYWNGLSLASKETVYRGFFCHQHAPSVAHAAPGVTGEEPAASPHTDLQAR